MDLQFLLSSPQNNETQERKSCNWQCVFTTIWGTGLKAQAWFPPQNKAIYFNFLYFLNTHNLNHSSGFPPATILLTDILWLCKNYTSILTAWICCCFKKFLQFKLYIWLYEWTKITQTVVTQFFLPLYKHVTVLLCFIPPPPPTPPVTLSGNGVLLSPEFTVYRKQTV